jgi:hypothetical protein
MIKMVDLEKAYPLNPRRRKRLINKFENKSTILTKYCPSFNVLTCK